jgi:hypothetical protein
MEVRPGRVDEIAQTLCCGDWRHVAGLNKAGLGLRAPKPQLTAVNYSQPSPTPSQSPTLYWYKPHHTHAGDREQAKRCVQHVSIQMVKSAWAGDVRWMGDRRRDRATFAPATVRFAGYLRVVAASPKP